MESKPKIAWIEDDNCLLEENLYFLSKIFDVDTFRRDSHHIDLSYARQEVITVKYKGIILDDMLLRQEVYPFDNRDVGGHLLEDIRSNLPNRKTPLLMYITENNPDILRTYMKNGADCVVPKSSQLLFLDLRDFKSSSLHERPDYTNFKNLILSAYSFD